MKRTWILLMAVVAGFAILTSTLSYGQEKKDEAAPEKTITGKVAVTKDGDTVKQITITQGEDAFCVCNTNDEGKDLAKLDGKTVKATGTVTDKDAKKVIKVTKFEEVKEEAK